MHEYVTSAIVLGRRPHRERDVIVDLFTEELGRVEARVVGGTRVLSKLSPHIDPLNRILIRLVKKNAFTLTDADSEERFRKLRGDATACARAMEVLLLLRYIAPRAHREPELWRALNSAFIAATISISDVLALLGYDPLHARCEACGSTAVAAFSLRDQAFMCETCRVKFSGNEVVLIRN